MSVSTPARKFQSSELSRNSREVFDAAVEQPVQVTRRDGEDLILMSKHEADARDELLHLASQMIAVSTDDRGTLGHRMANVFPWMLALPLPDQELCARELIDAARASFATGQPHLAAAEMISWRETATALAVGLGRTNVIWLDSDIVVERP